MKLYLHIGTEKTGSSFLQSQLANNRDFLIQNKFYYPEGSKYEEREMQSGRISPGNGKELYLALYHEEFEKVEKMLYSFIQESKIKNCSSILVSNENLVEVFSLEFTAHKFINICNKLKLMPPQILLVLRDPVSQALSLFKHRAKRGKITSLSEWLITGYNLVDYLNGFFFTMKKYRLNVLVKRYQKNALIMNRLFFQEWLGINPPDLIENTNVNPSLTLSELLCLKMVNNINPQLVFYYYEKLLSIPLKDKSDDLFLTEKYNYVIENYLKQFNRTWENYNKIIPKSDQLILPCIDENIIKTENEELVISFSNTQMKEILELSINGQNLVFKLKMFLKKMRMSVSKFLLWIKK